MDRAKRERRLGLVLTEQEMQDLEFITSAEGVSSKSEAVRLLIHRQKKKLRAEEKVVVDEYS